MTKKKDKDMKEMESNLRRMVKERYQPPLWKKFYELLEAFAVFCLLVLVVCLIVFIFAYLIDNPISLAILCATIVIIIVVVKLR